MGLAPPLAPLDGLVGPLDARWRDGRRFVCLDVGARCREEPDLNSVVGAAAPLDRASRPFQRSLARARLDLTPVTLSTTLALLVALVAACEHDAQATPDAVAPRLEEGPRMGDAVPPAGSVAWPHVCSVHHSLCVRPAAGTAPSVALAALAAADRAWDALTGALHAPSPEGALGDSWQAYLVDGVDGGARAVFEERDPLSHFDRGSSFALVDRATQPGCALDFALARAVAWGSLWRAAPATDEGSARAESEMLARLATPCATPDGEDVRAFQDQPERAVVDPFSTAFDRGATLFFDWVDATFGAEPGAVLLGMWALAPSLTAPQAWRWAHTPTGFDVLAVSLGDAQRPGSKLDEVFVRFAISRARAAPSARAGWHLAWPEHARRIASPEPVMPTGSSYVVIDATSAPPGAKLRLEAEWEDYGRMRWVVVELDGAGRTLAEIPITSLDHGTRASMTIDSLHGVDRMVVVAVNVGSTEHPFDPDQGEWEPHGWLLTVAPEGRGGD
jgi:hypothetical protein